MSSNAHPWFELCVEEFEPSCSARQHLQGERLRVTCIFHVDLCLPVLAYIRAGE